jgi:2-phosphosulfolactate phosphatase
MKKIDVCLSPDLIHLYDLSSVAVVVVDIFRATSCMVTAFASGAYEIVPVEEVELCQQYGAKGYLTAAERNGITPAGFDFDNSPFSYQVEKVKGAKICVTTTNGTVAIRFKSLERKRLSSVCWLERETKFRRHFVCRCLD